MELEIKNLCKKYKNSNQTVFENLNFVIKEGEFVCIIGPSGCGKSTLLNIIAGLEEATSGQLILDGKVVTKAGADRAVMFQEAALFPWLNVEENIRFGLKIAGVDKEEQEARIDRYLKMVQLSSFKKYRVHELSGGMKQRVALARSLALDSKILLMDEPFSALDKQTRNMLVAEIQNIWMATKKTMILITHSVEEALFFGDKIVMLGAKGQGIKHIYNVDIKRPRHIEDMDFVSLRSKILKEIKVEMEIVTEEEYDEA